MIEQLLPTLNGVLSQRRESLWATRTLIATADDAEFGCVAGKTYVLWVAQKDGKTKSGSNVTKGDWFVVEQA